jgi:PAS domain S-box-containing protein
MTTEKRKPEPAAGESTALPALDAGTAHALRRQAEERLERLFAASPASAELDAVVHELRVHQIELEMQNEELRRVQVEQQESREKFVELFDLAPVAYLTLSEDDIIGDANVTAACLLGVERQALVGQPFSAFVLGADADAYYLHRRMLQQTGEPRSGELRLRRAGNESFWVLLEWRLQRGVDGEPPSFWVTFTDIDEHKRAEGELQTREERLDRVIEGSGVGLWDWQVRTGETVFNERWAEIIGYTLAELLPVSIEKWRSLCHPDDLQRSDELLEQHFSGQTRIYQCEARMRHKDGHWVWVLDRGKVSERDPDGRPLRVTGSHLDISEGKRAEEALLASEARFRTAINVSPVPMALNDEQQHIKFLNEAFVQAFGYTEEDIPTLAQWWLNAYPDPEYREWVVDAWQAELERARRTGAAFSPMEVTVACKGGTIKTILAGAASLSDAFDRDHIVVLYDITDRKVAEEAVRDSEAHYRLLAENIKDVVWIMDAETMYFRYVSPSVERLRGFTPEEILAEPVTQALTAEAGAFVTDLTRSRVADVLAGKEPADKFYTEEVEQPCKDGSSVWTEVITSYYTNPQSGRVEVRGVTRDIAARKKAEEEIRLLNSELEGRVVTRTAQRDAFNRELEAFAYSAAHDLRAPLRTIDGFSKILVEDAGERLTPDELQHLERVRAAAQRMAQMIDDLMGLSKVTRRPLLRCSVDVTATAREVAEELRAAGPQRRVELVIAPGLTAAADPALLRLVLAQLLDNAWKFTSKHDEARIEVGVAEADGESAFFVRDDGAGFNMEYAKQLFGAFQRFHAAGEFEGDGIGLATVQRLVLRHGGRVWAEAEVEKGATFFFTLPEAELTSD